MAALVLNTLAPQINAWGHPGHMTTAAIEINDFPRVHVQRRAVVASVIAIEPDVNYRVFHPRL